MTLVLCNSVLQYLLFAKACRGICSTFDHTTPHTVCDYERSKAVHVALGQSSNYCCDELAAGEEERVMGRGRAFTAQVYNICLCVSRPQLTPSSQGRREEGGKKTAGRADPGVCAKILLFAQINSSLATTKGITVSLSLLT